MSFTQILLLAVGLAMDATAVAIARGSAASSVRMQDLLRLSLMFGVAQAVMPLIGFALGARLGAYVAAFDHWITFFVLSAVGLKMLHEAFQEDDGDPHTGRGFETRALLGLSIATSLDALAVGVTLPFVEAPLLSSVATIGLVTTLLSALGVLLGRRFGSLLGPRFDAFGGVLLIVLGLKILLGDVL